VAVGVGTPLDERFLDGPQQFAPPTAVAAGFLEQPLFGATTGDSGSDSHDVPLVAHRLDRCAVGGRVRVSSVMVWCVVLLLTGGDSDRRTADQFPGRRRSA